MIIFGAWSWRGIELWWKGTSNDKFGQEKQLRVSTRLISRCNLGCSAAGWISFFLNNQPDALIIQIYSFNVSGIFSAHHQECSTVHSALVSFMQVFDDRLQAESGWNYSSILTLLGGGHQNVHETYQCRMYSGKPLMMGKEDARNM